MDDYYDDGPPDYNLPGEAGRAARRELIEQPSSAPICPTCGQRHTRTGLWSWEGVPHTGWACIETEDLGDAIETCQMCEREIIRYVQIMQHPWARAGVEPLRCGCICAGHMEGDLDAARARDAEMKRAARQRKAEKKRVARLQDAEMRRAARQREEEMAWRQNPLRRPWLCSRRGNDYIETEGYRIVVWEELSEWAYRVTHIETGKSIKPQTPLPTQNAAKRQAFDAMMFLANKLSVS